MSKIKDIRTEIEELSSNLDEIYFMISEQGNKMDVLYRRARKEDTFNPLIAKHIVALGDHCARLIREKEILLQHIGLKSIFIPIKE